MRGRVIVAVSLCLIIVPGIAHAQSSPQVAHITLDLATDHVTITGPGKQFVHAWINGTVECSIGMSPEPAFILASDASSPNGSAYWRLRPSAVSVDFRAASDDPANQVYRARKEVDLEFASDTPASFNETTIIRWEGGFRSTMGGCSPRGYTWEVKATNITLDLRYNATSQYEAECDEVFGCYASEQADETESLKVVPQFEGRSKVPPEVFVMVAGAALLLAAFIGGVVGLRRR